MCQLYRFSHLRRQSAPLIQGPYLHTKGLHFLRGCLRSILFQDCDLLSVTLHTTESDHKEKGDVCSLSKGVVDDVLRDDVPHHRQHQPHHLADLMQHEALPDNGQPHVLNAVDHKRAPRAERDDVPLRLFKMNRKLVRV
jgi:hypothetical protein